VILEEQEIIDKNHKKWGLFFTTGGGKTLTSLALAEKNCKTCLILCPKMLKPMWVREVNKYKQKCSYTILTKEEFKSSVTELPAFSGIIGDEFHFFLGEKSQLSKRFAWYVKKHNIEHIWACTATPMLSTPISVYVLAKHLGHDLNYWAFKNKFYSEVRMGHRVIWKPRGNMDKELKKIIKSVGSVVDLETAVEMAKNNPHESLPKLGKMPEQIFETEYFDLTEEQKKAISNLQESQYITRWTKTSCIENGLLYSDGYSEDQVFPCKKTDRIIELVQQHDKIAIFCRYTKQLEYLNDLLIQHGHTTRVIHGEVKDRDAIVQKVETMSSVVLLVQSDTAFGWEAPSIHTAVFASLSFSYVSYLQALGRFIRINRLDHDKKFIHLVSNGIDRDVYDCIMKKEDFYIELHSKRMV